ncbi:SLBB domain-containing protein [Candidatus Marinimicrobia bacterium]|nr:SLBB domain-containing protein [Candidatus Neomarinimicrobiota bacterium]
MKVFLYILFSFSIIFCYSSDNLSTNDLEYITGDDGLVKMNVNIIGNVARPGTYLLYDGIDFMSALSAAGGYLQGSNLRKIMIISKDGTKTKINFNTFLNSESSNFVFELRPHDTIYISQKLSSKFLTTSNLPYTILGLINIAVSLNKD